MTSLRARLTWLLGYTVAMAYLESAVVVYLRNLYYPTGFEFPIILIEDWVAAIELGREAVTLVMLSCVAVLAGTDRWERFLLFCLSFGVWDILYYFWLWAFVRWPASLLTWDILFLIPVPWIGPVLAPVLISAALIAGSVWLLALKARGRRLQFASWHWGLATVGGALVLLSFTLDYRVVIEGRMPPPFRWGLFAAGMSLGGVAAALGGRSLRSAAANQGVSDTA